MCWVDRFVSCYTCSGYSYHCILSGLESLKNWLVTLTNISKSEVCVYYACDIHELGFVYHRNVQLIDQTEGCIRPLDRKWRFLNLFRAYSRCIRYETFSFMMSLPALFLGLRFCVSWKGGTGGGGWMHPKGPNSMAASGLIFRSDLVGTGRAISILFGKNGVRSHLVGPPFQNSRPIFQLRQVGISRET